MYHFYLQKQKKYDISEFKKEISFFISMIFRAGIFLLFVGLKEIKENQQIVLFVVDFLFTAMSHFFNCSSSVIYYLFGVHIHALKQRNFSLLI